MNLVDKIKLTPLLDTLRLQKISDEEYFSEHYEDYISNSRLGFINPDQDGSPQKFLDGFKGNKIFSDSLSLGTIVHEQTLQPELFKICPDLNRPTAKVGFIADELMKIAKDPENFTKEEFEQACLTIDYYKGNPSEKKRDEIIPKIKEYISKRVEFAKTKDSCKVSTFLDSKNIEKATSCTAALKANKKVQNLLHPTGILEDPISECEQAILLDVEVECPGLPKFIVRLKSKLDNYTIDKESNVITINDVKTIGKTLDKCDENINTYHYNREISMYAYLLSLCAKKFYGMNNPTVKGNFLWVSTIPSYYSKVTALNSKHFKSGFNEFKELLRLAAVTLYYKDSIKAEEYFGTL